MSWQSRKKGKGNMKSKRNKKSNNKSSGASTKPAPKKRTLTQVVAIVLVVLLILATVVTFGMGAFAATKIDLVGTSAIIYCKTTDEVIYEANADEPYNMASIAKLLTCYLALEKLDPQAEVQCNKDVRPCIDVVRGAIIASNNDFAKYLALEAGGDMPTFLQMMNEQAKAWGVSDKTEFNNTSGIDGLCVGTARDIAIITSHCMENELLREISGTARYTLPGTKNVKAQDLETLNYFLEGGSFVTTTKIKTNVDKFDGVFCGKTGTTEDSHTTMVCGIDCDGLECYCVLLNSTYDYRYSDMKKLLTYAVENTSKYVAFSAGDEFGTGKIWYGKDNVIAGVAAEDGIINLPEGASGSLVVSTATFDERIEAPVTAGTKIGTIEITMAGDPIRVIDLVAKEDMTKGWFLSRFRVTNAQTILIFLLIFLVFALFMFVVIMRAINRRKYAELRRQRLLEEARRRMRQERDYEARKFPR